ncbi:MAG: hypothetical protein HQ508_07970 [Candidatus Marinimicrobia bacterium]|nr:hypothetical protein [Candidatus Neomarinimicrobiota bacterium]
MEQPEQPEFSHFAIDGPPWEKKHEIGFFVAFIETIKAFLMRPASTYSVMRRKAGIGDALVYTVAIQVFSFLWLFAVTDASPEMFLPQSPEFQELFQLPENFGQKLVILYPFTVIILQFLAAYAFHLALSWRNLQNYDFSLIFRIVAYTSGTAAILSLIPIVGGFLSILMTVYLAYVGLRTIYALDVASFSITAVMALFITLGLYILMAVGLAVVLLVLSLII